MRTLCEVSWTEDVKGEPTVKTEKFWLLHWGLKMDIISDVPMNYTVAICSNISTGDVMCFLPEALKIIGTQIKE